MVFTHVRFPSSYSYFVQLTIITIITELETHPIRQHYSLIILWFCSSANALKNEWMCCQVSAWYSLARRCRRFCRFAWVTTICDAADDARDECGGGGSSETTSMSNICKSCSKCGWTLYRMPVLARNRHNTSVILSPMNTLLLLLLSASSKQISSNRCSFCIAEKAAVLTIIAAGTCSLMKYMQCMELWTNMSE